MTITASRNETVHFGCGALFDVVMSFKWHYRSEMELSD